MEDIKKSILAAYNFRHACKEFDPNKKISEEDFNFILETARLSPSSFGLEPWKFITVQDPALREKIKSVSWGSAGKLPTAQIGITLARLKVLIKLNSNMFSKMKVYLINPGLASLA